MAPVVLFFADMFRHWVGKMTGVMSLLLSIAPLTYPEWFTGSKGFFHQKAVYWFAAAVCLLIASYSAWSEKDRELRATQQKLDLVANKDRPEVFAHFGHCRLPKIDYSGTGLPECVQVSNLGKSDAWDVKITPFSLDDLRVDFFEVDFLRSDQNATMLEAVDGLPRSSPKTFKDVLARAEKVGFHTAVSLVVTWRDSAGNYFESKSEITYFPLDGSCYTEVGTVTPIGKVQNT